MTAKRQHVWLKWAAIALVLLCGAAVMTVVVIAHVLSELPDQHLDDEEPFDSAKWQSTDPDDAWRESMLDDLRQNYLMPGMTKDEVVKLLGLPGPGNSHPCQGRLPSPAIRETLCYTVSVGLDPCTFHLGFDGDSRFVESVKDCT